MEEVSLAPTPSDILGAARWVTDLGDLYQGNCLEVLPQLPDQSFDLIFADPPFNLGKRYGERVDDERPEADYLAWCKRWVRELVRVLAPGGSVFLYHLPKWNMKLGALLSEGLVFRNWIAIEMRGTFALPGRLYPSHYSMLYYTHGEPRLFAPPRLPLETCRDCGLEIHDYGGYKSNLNPRGKSLSDVWTDISPERHRMKQRRANELPIKLLDRVLDMSSAPDSRVLDPFAGSGTTLVAAELKGRRWTGIEIETIEPIRSRFASIGRDIQKLEAATATKNRLFTAQALRRRELRGKSVARFPSLTG